MSSSRIERSCLKPNWVEGKMKREKVRRCPSRIFSNTLPRSDILIRLGDDDECCRYPQAFWEVRQEDTRIEDFSHEGINWRIDIFLDFPTNLVFIGSGIFTGADDAFDSFFRYMGAHISGSGREGSLQNLT